MWHTKYVLINCLDKLINFYVRFPASIRLLVAKIMEVLKLYMDFWLCGELTPLIPALLKVNLLNCKQLVHILSAASAQNKE